MTPSLRSERLELRPGSRTALRAALEGRDALAAALDVVVPASWPPELYDDDAVRWTLDHLGDRADGGPYGFYYLILDPQAADSRARTPPTLIGVGGFKGPPDGRGAIELGYGVLPEYQRQGFATEAVRAWLALAFRDPAVDTVVGQTLASLAPSIGVLEKAGFRYSGAGEEGDAPAGERVIRYELARAAYAPDGRARGQPTAT